MTLNKDGRPRKTYHARGNDPHVQFAARSLYASGAGLNDVGKLLGMTATGVWGLLRRCGVSLRRPGRAVGDMRGVHRNPHVASMQAMRLAGWTFRAIGVEYGMSRQAVQQLLKKHP